LDSITSRAFVCSVFEGADPALQAWQCHFLQKRIGPPPLINGTDPARGWAQEHTACSWCCGLTPALDSGASHGRGKRSGGQGRKEVGCLRQQRVQSRPRAGVGGSGDGVHVARPEIFGPPDHGEHADFCRPWIVRCILQPCKLGPPTTTSYSSPPLPPPTPSPIDWEAF
jgi:hypothetical protein